MAQDTQFSVGSTIDHDGRALRIVKLLTDKGLTSRVYEGWLVSDDQSEEIHVAVKAMKALDFPLARQSFEQEGATLASMTHYEKKANEEQGLALKIAPKYYGSGDYEGVPYLVMEFVTGKEIPDLLHEKDGKLPEAQALTIVWHLLRTLDLLHTQLKKTYVDLKYENMWWVSGEGEKGDQLKLLDFGTLEEIKPGEETPRGVRRDLLQSGVYLCGMLTGQLPDYSMVGYLRYPREAGEIIRKNKESVSWGASKLLSRLLHRNPQARPTSAASLAAELRQLAGFWTSPLENVQSTARRLLNQAEEGSDNVEATRKFATSARAALDIVLLRNPDDEHISGDIERADKVLAVSDYLERGKKLLQTRSPDLARQVFEEGMYLSEEPGALRRWAYLARVGEKISPTMFDEHCQAAMQMLDWMNAGDLTHALERLEQLRPYLESEGLDMLYADANLFMQIAGAETARDDKKNYSGAAASFRQALVWLEKLPDAEFIVKEEIGDLYLLAKEMEDLHATVGAARAGMVDAEDLLRQPDVNWGRATALAAEAFARDRTNNERLADLLRLAEIAVQKYNFSAALQLAEIGLQGGKPSDELLSVIHLARQLKDAEQALVTGEGDNFHAALREARAQLHMQPISEPAIRHLRNRAAERAAELQDVGEIEKLARLAEDQADLGWANEKRSAAQKWAGQREDRLRSAIDRLLSDVTVLLWFDDLNPDRLDNIVSRHTAGEITAKFKQRQTRLEEAANLVADAERIAKEIDYRRDEIKSLRERLDPDIELEGKRSASLEQRVDVIRKERLAMLNRLWEELNRFLAWGKDGSASGARGSVLSSIARQAEEDAKELVRQCQVYLSTLDASSTRVFDLLNDIHQEVDRLGLKGWESFRQLADERTDKIHQEFQQARLAFMQGDLALATAEADRLETDFNLSPEWTDLKTQLAQTEMFQTWQREKQEVLESGWLDANILKSLRGFILLGLPAVYYRNASDYLKRAYSTAEGQVRSQLSNIESSNFIHAMRVWMDVELTSRMIRSLENSSTE